MSALRLQIERNWNGEPVGADEAVTIEILGTEAELLIEVEAPFHQDPPPPHPPGVTQRLWNHEVVELFVVAADSLHAQPHYLEIEMGPHGHYLVLELRGVRNPLRTGIEIDYAAEIAGNRWRGRGVLPRRLLPPVPHLVNAFALHGSPNERRYLAMSPVPGEHPDFHRLADYPKIALPGVDPEAASAIDRD